MLRSRLVVRGCTCCSCAASVKGAGSGAAAVARSGNMDYKIAPAVQAAQHARLLPARRMRLHSALRVAASFAQRLRSALPQIVQLLRRKLPIMRRAEWRGPR